MLVDAVESALRILAGTKWPGYALARLVNISSTNRVALAATAG